MTDFETDYLRKWTTPSFFSAGCSPELNEMQSIIQTELLGETVTVTIQIDDEILKAVSEYLATIGWTVEESCILFIKWCIANPERIDPWLKSTQE